LALVDRREIEFETDALLQAIAASARAAETFGLPGSAPNAVRFDPKECVVDFLYGSAQKPRTVRLKAEVIGALLVSYCIRARIPIPRNANKGVRIGANSVTLAFRSYFERAPTAAPEASPALASAPTSRRWVVPEAAPSR
jgi:hypothetical protein